MAERNESSYDAGVDRVDRFYLSDEFEEEEDETRPGPSKRAKTGAGTHQTKFKFEWKKVLAVYSGGKKRPLQISLHYL